MGGTFVSEPVAFISADDALALLRAAGHNAQRSPARGRCRTLCYLVGGQYVNLGRLRQMAAELSPAPAEPVAAEPAPAPQPVAAEPAAPVAAEPARPRPVLPGEAQPPAAPAPHGAAAPTLPSLRADAAAGRPVSLAALAGAIKAERSAPTGEGLAGRPWDPGTPAARAAAALQSERVGILWPISQALRGEGVALPPTWQHGGPVLDGTVPLARALAALPLGAIATAAAALAALPPVTAAQGAALSACRTGAVPGRPYL
jgi:translation initiation factor IF-2